MAVPATGPVGLIVIAKGLATAAAGATVTVGSLSLARSAYGNLREDTASLMAAIDDAAAGSNEGTPKTVDDILESATPGRVTKGKTTLYEKPGDFSQASKEFDSLNPSNVKDINTSYGQGKTGTLPDGRTITVRPGSTDGRPTLEIQMEGE